MSIFGSEVRNFDYAPAINVEEAAGYDDGVHSAQIAQIEGLQNHLALFEGGIKTDIQAAYMVSEGVDEEEVFAFSESVIGDMLKRIKEFFMKLWAKIKSIFRGFMARIDSVFMKSNKEFINKYKKDIIGKDLTDFEVTYRKKKSAYSNAVMDYSGLNKKAIDAGLILSTAAPQLADETKIKAYDDKFDSDDVKDKFLTSILGTSTDQKEFEKDAFDKVFEDEDSNEVSQSEISSVMNDMMTFKDERKNLKKNNDDINKIMSEIVKQLDKESNSVFKQVPNGGDAIKHKSIHFHTNRSASTWGVNSKDHAGRNGGTDSDISDNAVDASVANADDTAKATRNTDVALFQRKLGILSRSANIVQSCILKTTAVSMKIFDFNNKQNRKILAKAVAYKRKKDESVMMEALADLADWEADVVFD